MSDGDQEGNENNFSSFSISRSKILWKMLITPLAAGLAACTGGSGYSESPAPVATESAKPLEFLPDTRQVISEERIIWNYFEAEFSQTTFDYWKTALSIREIDPEIMATPVNKRIDFSKVSWTAYVRSLPVETRVGEVIRRLGIQTSEAIFEDCGLVKGGDLDQLQQDIKVLSGKYSDRKNLHVLAKDDLELRKKIGKFVEMVTPPRYFGAIESRGQFVKGDLFRCYTLINDCMDALGLDLMSPLPNAVSGKTLEVPELSEYLSKIGPSAGWRDVSNVPVQEYMNILRTHLSIVIEGDHCFIMRALPGKDGNWYAHSSECSPNFLAKPKNPAEDPLSYVQARKAEGDLVSGVFALELH